MEAEFDSTRPYIPIKDKNTGKTIKIQRCEFVFRDPLSNDELAKIESDKDLKIKKVEDGYLVSHFLDDSAWAERHGVTITNVYPVSPTTDTDFFEDAFLSKG